MLIYNQKNIYGIIKKINELILQNDNRKYNFIYKEIIIKFNFFWKIEEIILKFFL